MRSLILSAAFAALAFGAAPALADDAADLIAICKAEDPAPETCECQVKVIVENADARLIKAMIGMMKASRADTPENAEKAIANALAEAGLTQEEFDRLSQEADAQIGDKMDACKA